MIILPTDQPGHQRTNCYSSVIYNKYVSSIIRYHIVGLISKPRMDIFSNFTGDTFYYLNNSVLVKRLNNFYQTYKIISFNSSNVAFYNLLYI